MSAKVFKKDHPPAALPFAVPEIGEPEKLFEQMPEIFSTAGGSAGGREPPAPLTAPLPTAPAVPAADQTPPDPEQILREAREEAARIIAQAEQDALVIAEAAEEKGRQNVREAIREEVSREVAEIRANLARAIDDLDSLQGEITGRVETELVEFALSIARKIVRREVTIDREVALTLVKVSLDKLQNRTLAQIHLHPDDLAYVRSRREQLGAHNSLELVEDPTISPGGCLVHTETGDIDARIESQFEEIAHGLLND